ncbi:DMT family transporter [Kordiimonas lipolytica]|uniref:DMT family transporter n=1 Tax=Kordiimonas lipolytica TaxID=1662421 RepID=A0ABV8UBD8_9PROT|nr:DMT family transporter [Kordiimonas lipolytica]
MRVTLAFVGCVLIWGSTWYAIELQLGIVPKEWSLVYRFGIASFTLFLLCLVRKERLIFPINQHLWPACTGLFLFSATYVLTYGGAEYLTSGLVAITFALLSFLNIINGRIFLGNAIKPSALFSALLGILGLAFIFKPEIDSFTLDDEAFRGLLLCLGATLVCSFGNTFAGTSGSRSMPLFSFNAWALGYGALFNFSYAIYSGKPVGFDPSASYVGSLLYLAIVGTVIAFSMYIWLIEQIGIGRAAYMSVLTPVIALAISTVLEGFTWNLFALSGLALVVCGNLLVARTREKPSQQISKS